MGQFNLDFYLLVIASLILIISCKQQSPDTNDADNSHPDSVEVHFMDFKHSEVCSIKND